MSISSRKEAEDRLIERIDSLEETCRELTTSIECLEQTLAQSVQELVDIIREGLDE